VRELKQGDGPDLFVWGSSDLIQTLLAEDLVDELQLLIYPLTLGKGKRLLGEGTKPAAFKVTKSTVSPSGVVIATYQRAGEVKTGDFQLNDPSPAKMERRRKLK
jgi:dihydrofolate reductase